MNGCLMLFRGTWIGPASGKLNGNVASHNRGGQYLRVHTIPTDPNTATQRLMRQAITDAATQWQADTPEERQGWENWGRRHPRPNALGDAHTHSGWNEFCRWAVPRYYANAALSLGLGVGNAVPQGDEAKLSTAPTGSLITGNTIFRLTYDPADWWVHDHDNALLLYLCTTLSEPGVRGIHALRPTINWFRGPYQLVAAQPGDEEGSLSGHLDFTLPVTALENERMFWRAVLSTDDHGQSTEYTGVAIGS